MQQLAHAIKDIDEALLRKGTIGVKAPDVWGQNRMTQFRAEYEQVMARNKDNFEQVLNAAQRRTDVAALTNAMAISASLSPAPGPLGRTRPRPTAVAPVVPGAQLSVNTAYGQLAASKTGENGAAASGSSGGSANTGPGADAPLAVPDFADISARIDAMQKTVLNLPDKIASFATKQSDTGVGLEPTIRLDEQDRYLNHLHELRRKSAGDDLTDLPGYGLYLIRMPISVMPGEATRRGKGAIVTVEAKHELTEDLLENTFHDVVCRDVLYRLKEPVLWAIRNYENVKKDTEGLTAPDEIAESYDETWREKVLKIQAKRLQKRQKSKDTLKKLETELLKATLAQVDSSRGSKGAEAGNLSSREPSTAGDSGLGSPITLEMVTLAGEIAADTAKLEKVVAPPETPAPAEGDAKSDKVSLPLLGFGITGPNSAGNPQSELIQLIGLPYLLRLADILRASGGLESEGFAIDSKVFSWLGSETGNAYRFMRQAVYEADKAGPLNPSMCRIDELFRGPEIEKIADALLCRDYIRLIRLRNNFFARLYFRRNPMPYFSEQRYMSGRPEDKEYRIQIDLDVADKIRATDILCFMIVVQSILIDRQIKQDMRVLHFRLKNERDPFLHPDAADWPALDSERGPGVRFYDFRPAPFARQVFNEYVQRKWPIHVYALDPEIDQQNVLDAYSQRTELQLALSVSVAAGKVKFSDASKYARQLDEDLATIGLNRTAVGFGAGRSTFGWQFYPRVQSPPSPSNPARVIGTLLYNGTRPDYNLVNRRIEPGRRECVAIMVVPNFVPSIRMTSVSNWFGLGKHSEQKLDPGDLLMLSQKLQSARKALACTVDEDEYRPGELARMADRLDQLENLMPTQDFRVVLPDEGDLSGSEVFSSDPANLSPSLFTWFGEPPMVGQDSQVFLLGKAFSVTESKVIAGGVNASPELLSRNVIKITIPKTAQTVDAIYNSNGSPTKCFDVHLATPNGISDFHLLIPAKGEKPAEKPSFGYTVETKALDITIEYWPAANPGGGAAPVPLQYVRGTVSPDSRVDLSLKETVGIVPPAIYPAFAFPKIQNRTVAAYRPPMAMPFDVRSSHFMMHSPGVAGLANYIALALIGAGIDPRNPPADFKSLVLKPVKIRPFVGGHWGAEVEATGSLTVKITFALGPPAPIGPPLVPIPPVHPVMPGSPPCDLPPPPVGSAAPFMTVPPNGTTPAPTNHTVGEPDPNVSMPSPQSRLNGPISEISETKPQVVEGAPKPAPRSEIGNQPTGPGIDLDLPPLPNPIPSQMQTRETPTGVRVKPTSRNGRPSSPPASAPESTTLTPARR